MKHDLFKSLYSHFIVILRFYFAGQRREDPSCQFTGARRGSRERRSPVQLHLLQGNLPDLQLQDESQGRHLQRRDQGEAHGN